MRKIKSILMVIAACFILASCATTGNVSNDFVAETMTFEEWSADIKAKNPYKRVENPTKPMELYTNAQADKWEVEYSKGWLNKPVNKNKTFDDYLAKQWRTCVYNPEWQKSEAGQKWIQIQIKQKQNEARIKAKMAEHKAEIEARAAKAQAEAKAAIEQAKKARPLTKEEIEAIIMKTPEEIEIK